MNDLANRIGLSVCTIDFSSVITRAMPLSWTHDPFNRLITANASLHDSILTTKDQTILDNYPHEVWW